MKIWLLLGFVALWVGTTAAYLNPATGYELSIYVGTPETFWVLCAFSLLVSILVVFSASRRRMRAVGACLGGVTMTTIVSLPIIRGYHYFGEYDALSHLGTARAMNSGLMALTESRYPIVHPLGVVLHDATGLQLHHAMLILIVVFVVCFFVFVPLVVGELTNDPWAIYVGLYSGFLLLPLNHLAPSQRIHPTSQAIMFAPAFLFVFFRLYNWRNVRHSALFLLIAPMFVLLHPQQAANLVAVFSVIAALQIGYDTLSGYGLDRLRGWIIPEVTYFTIAFWLWVWNLPVFERNIGQVVATLLGETRVASSTAGRSGSLRAVGGSLPEVFLKLFLVSFVFIVLTGVLLTIVVRRFTGTESGISLDSVAPDGGSDRILLLSIYGGLVPVTLLFLIYLVGGISDQYFRHLGMLMMFATVLGSIAIGRAMRYMSHRWSRPVARRSIALVIILFTALSIPVVFTSPYIYDSSDHVTEVQMHGYATTFEHQPESMTFDDVRSSVYRYGHAIDGTVLPDDAYYYNSTKGIPDHFANRSLRSYYDESVYVPVTEADRIRDPVLWKGFRFSHEDFDYLDTEPGVNRVQTNGGYDLYVVNPREEPVNESSSGSA